MINPVALIALRAVWVYYKASNSDFMSWQAFKETWANHEIVDGVDIHAVTDTVIEWALRA